VGGNHDALALHPPAHITHRGEQGALWTHAQLRPDHLDFLRQLPLMQHHDTVLLVHASADRPGRWTYVDQPIHAERSLAAAAALDGRIRYVFSGHVHVQSLYFRTRTGPLMAFAPQPQVPISVPAHRQWLAIVGACGQPRDGDPRAMYALFDADQSQLTFHRVPYDVEAAMQAIARSGQPLAFAHRLESGQ
jgi:diadenosine tetraphosphatase ApaH/serine/threonine PP2A family protein phosphatase